MDLSSKLRAIRTKHVWAPLDRDPRSTDGLLLGYPRDIAYNSVLREGVADFSVPHTDRKYGNLSQDDKVLLYCYLNMKGHIERNLDVLYGHRTTLKKRWLASGRALMIDVGCGPATVCHALADLFSNDRFSYAGVNSADAMLKKARELCTALKSGGLMRDDCKTGFRKSWEDVDLKKIQERTHVVLAFSYLFASHTLSDSSVQSLADFTKRLRDSQRVAGLMVYYLNATNTGAVRRYNRYKGALGVESKPKVVQLRGKAYEQELVTLKED